MRSMLVYRPKGRKFEGSLIDIEVESTIVSWSLSISERVTASDDIEISSMALIRDFSKAVNGRVSD